MLRRGTIGMTQNKCKSIGLTGGIATGKSTVSNIIKEKGHMVIDADKISRQVMDIGKPAYKDVVETFGLKILLEDKSINRRKLARLIFSSKSLRNALNDIVHPYILQEIKRQYNIYCKDNDLVFLDIVMPKIDGNIAIQEIMAYDPNATIIIASSVGTQSQLKCALQAGAKDFIQKPLDRQQVLDLVNKFLEGR